MPAASTAGGQAGFGHALSSASRFIDGEEDLRLFEATRAMVIAARSWRKLTNERVMPLGQTMARWETLFHVAVTRANGTQRDLAQLVGVEGPTMARMLDRLARDGLIERSQCGVDRRVTRNRITPAGLEAVRQIMALTNELRRDILGGIDPDRLTVCVEVLSEISARLGAGRS